MSDTMQELEASVRMSDAERAVVRTRRRRRLVRVGGGVAALVVFVAAVIGSGLVIDAAAPGPDEVVQEYLDAIAAGDATSANRLAPPGASPYGTMLSDDVLSSADERISSIVVDPADGAPGADRVDVTGSYELGGIRHPFSIGVDRLGWFGSDRSFGSHWSITEPLIASVSVTADAGTTLSIGTTSVSALRDSVTLPLYPARYSLLDTGSSLVAVDPLVLDAGAAGAVDAGSGARTATPELAPALEAAVAERIAFCTTVTDPSTPACPFQAPVTGNVTWRLAADPTVTITSLPTPDGTPGGVTLSGGTAEFSVDGTTFTPVPVQASWTFTITGDTVAVTPF
ncbi:hypothetical protein F8O01_02685 [Pseudoclavibacter chungangensis]|uniref:Uncharacterized protein n=1 Tax=Pseudoclavibacter chungangensis TaxID=587635 RepID=A0A7J5C0J7_9MICO|nr:hypothetical protein [Pseudoclavibacter chungangensis]KAB1660256.1 hypothetical protein F8O01_02685 [Pseudoclavibacter chungangensis]NYJ65599.1 hypothetical protein [Pseudoclavibacter chungangensis]